MGRVVLSMLNALGCRGPDSAGVALYGLGSDQRCILRVKLLDGKGLESSSQQLRELLRSLGVDEHHFSITGSYGRIAINGSIDVEKLIGSIEALDKEIEVISAGRMLEIIKQVGSPANLESTYGVSRFCGTHGLGHTRLSTESKVDLSHSQPFWAHGVPDLATVHNGHITNYHKLRRRYEQRGYRFFTDNDSEVIGVYLRDRMSAGMPLADALRSSLDDFDGSFSYLAASADSVAYVRDRYGFKPLMLAETGDFVAIATEEIALRQAFGSDFVVREPAPGTMAVWSLPAVEKAMAS